MTGDRSAIRRVTLTVSAPASMSDTISLRCSRFASTKSLAARPFRAVAARVVMNTVVLTTAHRGNVVRELLGLAVARTRIPAGVAGWIAYLPTTPPAPTLCPLTRLV